MKVFASQRTLTIQERLQIILKIFNSCYTVVKLNARLQTCINGPLPIRAQDPRPSSFQLIGRFSHVSYHIESIYARLLSICTQIKSICLNHRAREKAEAPCGGDAALLVAFFFSIHTQGENLLQRQKAPKVDLTKVLGLIS